MQAWNLYLLVILSHNSVKVLEMTSYAQLLHSFHSKAGFDMTPNLAL